MLCKLLIFSSSEGLRIAQAIQQNLSYEKYSCKLWNNNIFPLSQYIMNSLDDLGSKYDFIICVLTPDDFAVSRGEIFKIPRDNLLLELGLSIAYLGLKRTIIVNEKSVKLPSDLNGIISAPFLDSDDKDAAVGHVCAKIDQYIDSFANDAVSQKQNWDDYCLLIAGLINRLKKTAVLGGYYFDAIVGVSRAGLLIADLIARAYDQNMPVISLYADRRTGHGTFDSTDSIVDNEYTIQQILSSGIKYILVVDSNTKTGITITRAKEYLQKKLGSQYTVKSAVIVADSSMREKDVKKIDFVMKRMVLTGTRFPYHRFEIVY